MPLNCELTQRALDRARTGSRPRINAVVVLAANCVLLMMCASADAYYSSQQGRWLSRDPMPGTEVDAQHLYSFVVNRPIAAIDSLGWAITDVSFIEGSIHGSIERYYGERSYESVVADNGAPRTESWGSVSFDYSAGNSRFSASVEAMTDFSKAPPDTLYIQPSAHVVGEVEVKACCSLKEIDVAWSAQGAQDRGRRSEVQIDSMHFATTRSATSFSNADTFRLQTPSANGVAKFRILVATYWQDVPPAAGRQTGSATLSVAATCHCD